MKNRNIMTICFGLLITFITLIIMLFHYNFDSQLVIYTKKDSYANQYAKKHSIRVETISSKEAFQLNKQIEEFSYHIVNQNITITNYSGISKRLVIPEFIKGQKVTKLEKGMLASNKEVETIVLPKTITEIEIEDFKEIKIECFHDDYCDELKQNENLKVTILDDSDNVDFNNQVLPFHYEENENHEIELIRYFGTSSTVIVPSTINGYPVTKISFSSDLLEAIYLPSNISSINDDFLTINLYKIRISVIITMILSFLLFSFFNIRNENQTLEKKTRNVILIMVSILYLIMMGIFSFTISDFKNGTIILFVEFAITSSLYSFFMVLLRKANKEIEISETNDKYKNEFLKTAKMLVAEIEDKELKELITYSDPVSNEATEKIEKEILSSLTSYDKTRKEQIIKQIKKRNLLLKENK